MSKHFKTAQLVPCSTADKRCVFCRWKLGALSPNVIGAYTNAWALADDILEPARAKYGKPIMIMKCFQCYDKVKKQGIDERYMEGKVADIRARKGLMMKKGGDAVTREENLKIAKAIAEVGKFDELILQYTGEDDLKPMFVTVSYEPEGVNRGEIWQVIDGIFEYVRIRKEELMAAV